MHGKTSLAAPIAVSDESESDEDDPLVDVRKHRKHERIQIRKANTKCSDKKMERMWKTVKTESQDPLEVDWEDKMFLDDNNYLFENSLISDV